MQNLAPTLKSRTKTTKMERFRYATNDDAFFLWIAYVMKLRHFRDGGIVFPLKKENDVKKLDFPEICSRDHLSSLVTLGWNNKKIQTRGVKNLKARRRFTLLASFTFN